MSVAAALPEIEPKMALAITAAVDSPPRTRPTKSSARYTMGIAIRPFSMMPPAMMKSGMASSTRLFMRQCPDVMNVIGSVSVNIAR